jgi:hypothetical protein
MRSVSRVHPRSRPSSTSLAVEAVVFDVALEEGAQPAPRRTRADRARSPHHGHLPRPRLRSSLRRASTRGRSPSPRSRRRAPRAPPAVLVERAEPARRRGASRGPPTSTVTLRARASSSPTDRRAPWSLAVPVGSIPRGRASARPEAWRPRATSEKVPSPPMAMTQRHACDPHASATAPMVAPPGSVGSRVWWTPARSRSARAAAMRGALRPLWAVGLATSRAGGWVIGAWVEGADPTRRASTRAALRRARPSRRRRCPRARSG